MEAPTTRTPRILFVDDDERLLDGLRRALRRHRHEWDMSFAGGGWEALRYLEEHAVDIVVTDMRMPDMDGAELLACVRDRQPTAIRLVLSGQASRDAALRAAQLTHQFLPKPIEMPVLERVLARALALRDLVAEPPVRSLVNDVQALPSVPGLYVELTRSAAEDGATVPHLTRMIERDSALSAKILQVANSAFFGLPRETSSIEKAVTYLGLDVIRSLVLTTSLYCEAGRTAAGLDLVAEQEHALSVAVLARKIAEQQTGIDAAFTAGLLHDVGKLVLAAARRAPSSAAPRSVGPGAGESPDAPDVPDAPAPPVDHAAVGAYLLGVWGLPQQVVEAVAYHHAPATAPHPAFDVVAAVHVADALVREREAELRGQPGDVGASRLDEEYVGLVGIQDRLPRWRAAASEVVTGG